MVSYTFEGHQRFWSLRDESENEKIFGPQSRSTGEKIPVEMKHSYVASHEYVVKRSLSQLMPSLRLYAAVVYGLLIVVVILKCVMHVSYGKLCKKLNFKATYRYEKKRIKQRIRRGLGARTKFKWFALADALLRNVQRMSLFLTLTHLSHHLKH